MGLSTSLVSNTIFLKNIDNDAYFIQLKVPETKKRKIELPCYNANSPGLT